MSTGGLLALAAGLPFTNIKAQNAAEHRHQCELIANSLIATYVPDTCCDLLAVGDEDAVVSIRHSRVHVEPQTHHGNAFKMWWAAGEHEETLFGDIRVLVDAVRRPSKCRFSGWCRDLLQEFVSRLSAEADHNPRHIRWKEVPFISLPELRGDKKKLRRVSQAAKVSIFEAVGDEADLRSASQLFAGKRVLAGEPMGRRAEESEEGKRRRLAMVREGRNLSMAVNSDYMLQYCLTLRRELTNPKVLGVVTDGGRGGCLGFGLFAGYAPQFEVGFWMFPQVTQWNRGSPQPSPAHR